MTSISTSKPEKELTIVVAPGQPSVPAKASQPSTTPFKHSRCGGTNQNAYYCRWRGRSELGKA